MTKSRPIHLNVLATTSWPKSEDLVNAKAHFATNEMTLRSIVELGTVPDTIQVSPKRKHHTSPKNPAKPTKRLRLIRRSPRQTSTSSAKGQAANNDVLGDGDMKEIQNIDLEREDNAKSWGRRSDNKQDTNEQSCRGEDNVDQEIWEVSSTD
ncbi:Ff.00g065800.m01.CDS01 [Fusarium sp. VM40]|nr:Ff.00g065800.m01.CDS01 [Fusarium sp. VM40]